MKGPRHAFTVLGLVMIAIVIAMADWSGIDVVLIAALALFGLSAAAYLLWRTAPLWAVASLYALSAASIVLVYWIDSHATPIGLFLLGALVSLREPRRVAWIVLAVATGVYSVVQLGLGDPWLEVLATGAGIVFFALLGKLFVSERSQREQIASLLLEVERSREAEQRASVEAERARMARDLHDVLAHTLSGLAIQLETVRILARDSSPSLRDAAERAHQLSRAGLQEARRAVATLRGEELPGPELLGALVEEHRLSSAGPVRFSVTGTAAPLSAEAGLAIYRTAQESLSNVRKHAAGAAVSVELEWAEDEVVLTIEDSGGSKNSIPIASGYGLAGMAERAEALGAVLDAGPTDTGFRVRLAVPVKP